MLLECTVDCASFPATDQLTPAALRSPCRRTSRPALRLPRPWDAQATFRLQLHVPDTNGTVALSNMPALDTRPLVVPMAAAAPADGKRGAGARYGGADATDAGDAAAGGADAAGTVVLAASAATSADERRGSEAEATVEAEEAEAAEKGQAQAQRDDSLRAGRPLAPEGVEREQLPLKRVVFDVSPKMATSVRPHYLARAQQQGGLSLCAPPAALLPRCHAALMVEQLGWSAVDAAHAPLPPPLSRRRLAAFSIPRSGCLPPFPLSYLVAFTVGEFEAIRTTTPSGIRLSAWAPAATRQVAKLRYALKIARDALTLYEKLLGVPFPLPKIDIVSIPDFGPGAMENWGLITYRATSVLADEHSAPGDIQSVACTVVHELGHQVGALARGRRLACACTHASPCINSGEAEGWWSPKQLEPQLRPCVRACC